MCFREFLEYFSEIHQDCVRIEKIAKFYPVN